MRARLDLAVFAVLAALGAGGCNRLLDNGNYGTPGDATSDTQQAIDAAPDVCAAQGKPPRKIHGIVYAPNGTLPLYGAKVYIPTTSLMPVPDGVSNPTCVSGLPAEIAQSDTTGRFELVHVPTGDVPLVIQIGKWRREVTVTGVAECGDTTVPPALTHLPRNGAEGSLPHIAITTGIADNIECIARDVGIDATEIGTGADFTGHVHLYVENGTNTINGIGQALDPISELWAALAKYDIIMMGCGGAPSAQATTPGLATSLEAWTESGGWLFLTHFGYAWLTNGPTMWRQLASFGGSGQLDAGVVTVDTATPVGQAFAQWLISAGVSPTAGKVPLMNGRNSCTSVGSSAQRRLYLEPALNNGHGGVQSFTWDGIGGGRVTFDDVHVSADGASNGQPYPLECGTPAAQEIAIMFQLFETPTCE
jgi:hypothetical protein